MCKILFDSYVAAGNSHKIMVKSVNSGEINAKAKIDVGADEKQNITMQIAASFKSVIFVTVLYSYEKI